MCRVSGLYFRLMEEKESWSKVTLGIGVLRHHTDLPGSLVDNGC